MSTNAPLMAGARKGSRALTPRQIEYVGYIRGFILQHGYSPSIGEIARAFGVTRSAVSNLLDVLCSKGAIEVAHASTRGIRVLDSAPFAAPMVGDGGAVPSAIHGAGALSQATPTPVPAANAAPPAATSAVGTGDPVEVSR